MAARLASIANCKKVPVTEISEVRATASNYREPSACLNWSTFRARREPFNYGRFRREQTIRGRAREAPEMTLVVSKRGASSEMGAVIQFFPRR